MPTPHSRRTAHVCIMKRRFHIAALLYSTSGTGEDMRVLVTGATDAVGTKVVARLVNDGAQVRAMVPPDDPHGAEFGAVPSVERVEADLGDQAMIDDACRDITHVIHLAAQPVRGDTPVDRFYDVNAFGTLRLLEGVQRAGAVLERFVLASSGRTYRPARPPERPLREQSHQEPADYYGTSRLLAEVILRNHAAQFGVPFSIVRLATVITPEDAGSMFRLGFWREALDPHPPGTDSHLWPSPDCEPGLLTLLNDQAGDSAPDTAVGLCDPDLQPWTLSVLDVRDAAEGVFRALTEPGAVGHVFNLAAIKPTAHDDGALAVSRAFGVPRLMVTMPMRHRLELSIDAAIARIGFYPRNDFHSTLQDGLRPDGGLAPLRTDRSGTVVHLAVR